MPRPRVTVFAPLAALLVLASVSACSETDEPPRAVSPSPSPSAGGSAGGGNRAGMGGTSAGFAGSANGGAGLGGAGVGGSTAQAGAGGSPAPPPPGPITGRVTHHAYTFDLASAKATSQLTVDVAAPGGDCFAADFALANATNTRWNGVTAKSADITSATLALCGAPVGPGTSLLFAADSAVPTQRFLGLDVGFSRTKDRAGGSFSYLLSWVGGCSHFGPCDADPAALSTFRFEIDHAPSDVVLCPGTRTVSADGKRTTCVLEDTPAPTYSAFGLAADPLWQRKPFVTAAGVDIVFFETPGGTIAQGLDATTFASFFTWITDLLGPYPYGKELRFAGGPTKWLGFEHPANIVLQEHLADKSLPYENAPLHVAMHEIIHQWAGDRTTLATAVDFVWKEAIAEYLAYVFEDEHQPIEEGRSARRYWKAISLSAATYPRPMDEPAPEVQKFYGDVYGPGPMVLFVQLEPLIGRAAILAGLKAFLATSGARSVGDLRDALAAASGRDLQPYFDAWVFGSGAPAWPTLTASTKQDGDLVTVTVEQDGAGGQLHGCKVELLLEGATERVLATVDFGLAPTSNTATATVKLGEPLVKTTIDPEARLVARVSGPTSAPLVPVQIYPL